MGAIRSNFKAQQAVQNRPDIRAEFEKMVIAAGAKGSFMVFKLSDKETPPTVESGP